MNSASNTEMTVLENEPLSKHSSFKIGGCANYAIFPKSTNELIKAIEDCKENEIKYMVVGNGSNVLFDDEGFDGAVIITKQIKATEYIYGPNGIHIKCECGKSLSELSSEVGRKHSLTGLEFAYGIPGTVGGAVFMNAGAYGGQMSDIVEETEYYDTFSGSRKTIAYAEHGFDYRHSLFASHPEYIILSTTLKLSEGDAETIFESMNRNMTARKDKQPLEYPNAGSTFKRPAGGLFAGKLIEDCGLKGYTVGGAQVSEKHAGFTINRGHATCKDVLSVIEHTQNTVLEKYGVKLECEIIYVPK